MFPKMLTSMSQIVFNSSDAKPNSIKNSSVQSFAKSKATLSSTRKDLLVLIRREKFSRHILKSTKPYKTNFEKKCIVFSKFLNKFTKKCLKMN